MVIEDRDIMHINAIMSVGLLIFVSLMSLYSEGQSVDITYLFRRAFVIVSPFLVTVIVSLIGLKRLSKWLTVGSFGWLLFFLIFSTIALSIGRDL
jgi:cell division protein FtsW (lipid II flippase)